MYELEQYPKINDVVVTGLETRHKTYARATAAESGDPQEQDLDTLQQQILSFL